MNKVLAVAELRLLRARDELQWGAQVLALTPQERVLLTCLLAAPGELVSIRTLQATLWPHQPAPPSNVLPVLVARLRRKLARLGYPGAITTVRRQGYRFAPAAPGSTAPGPAPSRRLRGRAILAVDPEQCTMRVGPRTVPLTPLEARLLALLRQEAGRVVAHARLQAAWSDPPPLSANTLHVYVRRLRRHLQAAGSTWRLRTLHGRGYLLELPPVL
jgi:DNA-binding response OmpR family regulator